VERSGQEWASCVVEIRSEGVDWQGAFADEVEAQSQFLLKDGVLFRRHQRVTVDQQTRITTYTDLDVQDAVGLYEFRFADQMTDVTEIMGCPFQRARCGFFAFFIDAGPGPERLDYAPSLRQAAGRAGRGVVIDLGQLATQTSPTIELGSVEVPLSKLWYYIQDDRNELLPFALDPAYQDDLRRQLARLEPALAAGRTHGTVKIWRYTEAFT